jgi:hypothetical protein
MAGSRAKVILMFKRILIVFFTAIVVSHIRCDALLISGAVLTEVQAEARTFFYGVVTVLPAAEATLSLFPASILRAELSRILTRKKDTSLLVEGDSKAFVLQILFDENSQSKLVVYLTDRDFFPLVMRSIGDCGDKTTESAASNPLGISGLQLGFGALLVGFVGGCARAFGTGVFAIIKKKLATCFEGSPAADEICTDEDRVDIENSGEESDSGDVENREDLIVLPTFLPFAAGLSNRRGPAAGHLSAPVGWCDVLPEGGDVKKFDFVLNELGFVGFAWCKDSMILRESSIVVATRSQLTLAVVSEPAQGRIIFLDALMVDVLDDEGFIHECIKNKWTIWVLQSYQQQDGSWIYKKNFQTLSAQLKQRPELSFVLCEQLEDLGQGLFSSNMSDSLRGLPGAFSKKMCV